MLDDLDLAQKDPEDMLATVLGSLEQFTHQFAIDTSLLPKREDIDHVVLLGMGGSALAAEFLKVWPGLDVPYVVSRTYNVPPFVSDRTFVIACSYSGNTEETLSAMDEAQRRGAKLAVVAQGGKLLERAKSENLPHAAIPAVNQPRSSVFYQLRALATLLQGAGFFKGALAELAAAASKLRSAPDVWKPEVPTAQNPAKQIALELFEKTPIIYAGPDLFAAAYKWKIDFNESAKNLAWCNELPEFNHNEFLGWSSHPTDKPFAVINLLSTFDHPRVQQRFVISDKLLAGKRPESISVQAQGDTLLEQIVWTVMFGDAVSVYLAFLNGVDPTPVDLVEELKKELAKA